MCVCINYYAQWSFVHNSILYMYELLYLNKKNFRASHGYARLVYKLKAGAERIFFNLSKSFQVRIPVFT